MKNLLFFLSFIMLLPFGSKQIEAFEKNEVERIEYFSQSHRLPNRLVFKNIYDDVLPIELPKFLFNIQKTSFIPIKIVQKIFLFHSRLLI
ncbi:hypothetical protein QYS48_29485 [Marivirga arenosa]|uniref:Uncharacterized protein n=1 Tax=Marivirga arenosa TaxID=3059076 RepID=A0AA51N7G7_9BACT|nr:hypothetical protein [Marivirga sp. ABR2-2]WMN07662.1 hypothetical protein QYS48_29485 [Marivirga sp. ABR2-2]